MTSPVNLIAENDPAWIASFLNEHWGGPTVVSSGRIHEATDLDGFRAVAHNGTFKGFASYRIGNGECELVTLNSLISGEGTGLALVSRVLFEARRRGCSRVWAITTNDNLNALRFYQKRGFRLVAVYPGAVDKSRSLKPEIPEIGYDAIPIRDEIELEWRL